MSNKIKSWPKLELTQCIGVQRELFFLVRGLARAISGGEHGGRGKLYQSLEEFQAVASCLYYKLGGSGRIMIDIIWF